MDLGSMIDTAAGWGLDLLAGRAGPLGYVGEIGGAVLTQYPSKDRAALWGLVRGLPSIWYDSWDNFIAEWGNARADDTLTVSEIKALKGLALSLVGKSADSIIDLVFVVVPFWFTVSGIFKGRGK